MLPEQIIWIGILINLFCTFWYIRSIFKSGTKPNLISWFVWMLAPFIGTFFALKAGAGFSVSGIFMAGFGPLIIIIFALLKKNAFWKIEKFDIVCGIFSIIALLIYIFTYNLNISIIFAILSDMLAGIPTIKKAWKHPETENPSTYIAGGFNNLLSLFVIREWIFSIYSFNIYLLIINIMITFAIYHKKIKKEIF